MERIIHMVISGVSGIGLGSNVVGAFKNKDNPYKMVHIIYAILFGCIFALNLFGG